MRLPYIASAVALWPFLGAVAKEDPPTIIPKKFEQAPHNVFFFEDSETALALVSDIDGSVGQVYKSDDAGAEWAVVEDFPDGEPYVIYPHPTDKTVAVTLGRSKTHWITYDRGKTWKSFKTPDHPSRYNAPIKFHASNSKRLMFQGIEECDILSMACLGKVSDARMQVYYRVAS